MKFELLIAIRAWDIMDSFKYFNNIKLQRLNVLRKFPGNLLFGLFLGILQNYSSPVKLLTARIDFYICWFSFVYTVN